MKDYRNHPIGAEEAAEKSMGTEAVEALQSAFMKGLDLSETRMRDQVKTSFLEEDREDAKKNAEGSAFVTVGQLRQWSKSDLAREIVRLNGLLNKVDLAGMMKDVQERRAGMVDRPKFNHAEAFMLMTYRSEGGTHEQKIWNSRDGVTPYQVHVDGVKLTHAMHEMTGPYMDRPEGCVAQWETRTERAMIEAWRRSLERALLAGRMSKDEANAMADSVEHARAYHMSIGLRSMVTGRFTDEA